VNGKTRATFEALVESSNFRRYFLGQTISQSGTWMQSVGQGWLVLELTHSPAQVGFVIAVQTLPILLLGPAGGVVVDRHDTRRLLLLTQVVAGVQAAALGALTVAGVIQLWMVYVLAAVYGMVQLVDNPARQAFALEIVGPELLTNAVTLNSINMNAARVIGPSFAAALIAWLGIGQCFLINAATFAAVIVAILLLDVAELHPARREARHKGQLTEGLVYVWRTPELRIPLIVMTIIGTLTYEFSVSLPAMAEETFHGSASTYGLMTGAMGLGAVVGGLLTASRAHHGLAVVVRQALVFGVVVLALAVAPTLPLALVALGAVGAASLVFLARANATVQLLADPAKRGRVMALWTMAFLGTTPVGAPLVGWLAQTTSPRWALAMGGIAALASAGFGVVRAHGREAVGARIGAPMLAGAGTGAAAVGGPGAAAGAPAGRSGHGQALDAPEPDDVRAVSQGQASAEAGAKAGLASAEAARIRVADTHSAVDARDDARDDEAHRPT
jgi:MFS family permease